MLLALDALLIGYLPGALLFRLPFWNRERRAALSPDERVFWHVLLSLGWSLTVVLLLAAFGAYRFDRLVLANAALSAALALIGRRGLLYGGTAARVTLTTALPILLVVLGMWRFFPPSEYIIGGKDPGTLLNQGIQIAQHGTLTIHDPVVAAVPDYARDLFFPPHYAEEYYGTRFMGFFIRDPRTGDVNGQFFQLFPASMAIGYGLNGLTGARLATGAWAVLGLLAVYFAGARLFGRPAALAASVLVSVNVIEVWFGRYPNSEMAMQPLLFAALLAFARSQQDDDRFFGPVAGLMAGLMLFARFEALLVLAGLLVSGVLTWLVDRKTIRTGFLMMAGAWTALAWVYYKGPALPYTQRLFAWLDALPMLAVTAAAAGGVLIFAVLIWMRSRFADQARALVPEALSAAFVLLAVYAAIFREPGGRLAEFDAYALRTFTRLYLLWPGLAAALIGFVLVVRRHFWRDPGFVVVFSGLCLFLFYKTRIVPIEFWAARRYVPIVLPGALLFAAAAAFGAWPERRQRWWVWPRRAAGLALLAVLGFHYGARAAPVMPHVEYAGMIPAIEQLASKFSDRDLVLVESRDAGADTHVLALPLAYVYARNVLVLNSARPDKLQLRLFLEHAVTKYSRIYFVGGGGTDLLSRHITARAVDDAKIKVPEFESIDSTKETLPSTVRRKDFDYSVYELAIGAAAQGAFSLDVGLRDDLHVLRFNAKETTEGRTIRWTAARSVIAISGMTGNEREVVLVMQDGGRPAQASPARVEVYLNNVLLGSATVVAGFQPYRFVIPPAAAAAAAATEDPAQLTLVSNVWMPRQFVGGSDDRQLGVMLDRVEIR